MDPRPTSTTRSDIVNLAQQAIAAKGYSAFSFEEIAEQLGIETMLIQSHFPNKADLGVAVALQYRQEFENYLHYSVESGADPLQLLVDVYHAEVQASLRMTVCIMLAAESENLPSPIHHEIEKFYQFNVQWLCESIAAKGHPPAEAKQKATQTMALLQGGLMSAKAQRNPEIFVSAINAIDVLIA